MGIRIAKHLCYALGDVQYKDFEITDPRFQSWVNEDDEMYERCRTMIVPFIEWILDRSKDQEKKDVLEMANGPSVSDYCGVTFGIYCAVRDALNLSSKDIKFPENEILNFSKDEKSLSIITNLFVKDFIHSIEFGKGEVFGIIPLEVNDWRRYDNILDYYESGGTAEPKVDWLETSIYPHIQMVRKPHLEKIKIPDYVYPRELPFLIKNENGFFQDRLDPMAYNILIGKNKIFGNVILNEEDRERVKKSYRFDIHSSVLLWTYYIGIFNDWSKTVNELRPCIYTYWS